MHLLKCAALCAPGPRSRSLTSLLVKLVPDRPSFRVVVGHQRENLRRALAERILRGYGQRYGADYCARVLGADPVYAGLYVSLEPSDGRRGQFNLERHLLAFLSVLQNPFVLVIWSVDALAEVPKLGVTTTWLKVLCVP